MQFGKKISQLIIKPMLFCGQKGFPGHERRWRPQEEGQVQVSSHQEAFSTVPLLHYYIQLGVPCLLHWFLF